MRILKDALENKKSINKIKNHKLSASHMQILLDLQDKIDIDDLLDPALSIAQLECCGQAKIQGISYDIFIKYPNFAMFCSLPVCLRCCFKKRIAPRRLFE